MSEVERRTPAGSLDLEPRVEVSDSQADPTDVGRYAGEGDQCTNDRGRFFGAATGAVCDTDAGRDRERDGGRGAGRPRQASGEAEQASEQPPAAQRGEEHAGDERQEHGLAV